MRPLWHVTAPTGWLSDPNGLVFWRDQWHVFYQANPDQAKWGLMRWGHVTSPDLVDWQARRLAMEPVAGTTDEDGCWSGCTTLIDGRPVVFYTGATGQGQQHRQVVMRIDPPTIDGPNALDIFPSATRSVALEPDPKATSTSFQRDPFVFRHGGRWLMLLGTGLEPQPDSPGRGAVVAYKSNDAKQWRYSGMVFAAPDWCSPNGGPVWECPQLVQVGQTWVLLVSAQFPGPRCPYTLWFTGSFDGRRFIPHAQGVADAGQVAYATALTTAPDGRVLAWSWIQEDPDLPAGNWAGLLSAPRVLDVENGQVVFTVAQELDRLWVAQPTNLAAHQNLPQVSAFASDTTYRTNAGKPDPDNLDVLTMADAGVAGKSEVVELVDAGKPLKLMPDPPPAYRLEIEVDQPGLELVLGMRHGTGPVRLVLDQEPQQAPSLSAWSGSKLLGQVSDLAGPPYHIQIFRDATVAEVFLQGRCLTFRTDADAGPVALGRLGQTPQFARVQLMALRPSELQ